MHPGQFTPETSAAANAIANQKHPGRLFTSETAKAASLLARGVPKPSLRKVKPSPEQIEINRSVKAQLDITREQIALTRSTLNDTTSDYCEHCRRAGMEAHHRAALLRALDTLMDRERILLGIPSPGTRKPAPERKVLTSRSDPLEG